MPSRKLSLLSLNAKPFKTSNPLTVEGGSFAKLKHIKESCDIQDLIPLGGRRILAYTGINGASGFSIENGTNPASVSQVYPTKDKTRLRSYSKHYLTPGMNLFYTGLLLPSGPTNAFTGVDYEEDSRYGSVKIQVTWDNGIGTETTIVEIATTSSGETYGAEPEFYLPGGLQFVSGQIQRPIGAQSSSYSGNVEVTIGIAGRGSVRVVDFAVYESPKNASIVNDDTHRETVYHGGQHTYPSEYAITATEFTGDARFGARQRLKTIHDQRQYLGPEILQLSSWDEDNVLVSSSEPIPITVTATSFTNIRYSSLTTYSDTYPGFSVSSGCHGRCAEWSGILELREKTAVIPVVIRVYAKIATGYTGTIRFQTAPHSYCDLTVTNTSYDWIEGLAWLEVPVSQNIKSVLNILAKRTIGVASSFNIQYINIHYGGHYTLSE